MGIKIDARLERGAGFTRLIEGLGTPKLMQAAAAGLNEHMRLQEKQLIRVTAGQTSIREGRIKQVTRLRGAGAGARSEAAVVVADGAIPLGRETSLTAVSGGVRSGDWVKHPTHKGAFIIKKWGGAFVRRSGDPTTREGRKKKRAVAKLWGPVLPSEVLRTDQPAFQNFERFALSDMQQRVLKRVLLSLGL